MISFYVVINKNKPDIRVQSYIEMIGCLFNDPSSRAYLYRKAPGGLMKPLNVYKVVNDHPIQRVVTAFRCPPAYFTYPEGVNKCGCGWHHLQGNICMNLACNYSAFEYSCPTCGVNSIEGTCVHMCPDYYQG